MPGIQFLWLFISLLVFFPGRHITGIGEVNKSSRMHGVSFVAPPKPFEKNPMPEVEKISANWIAVLPFAYSGPGEPRVMHDVSRWQWWGERPDGVRKTIELAKEQDLNVLLKPHIWIPGSWSGEIDFDSKAEWEKWEDEYEAYILSYAKIAREMEVELFCIGNELKISVKKRPAFWNALIEKVREIYDGPIIYAANWDNYRNVPFWQQLDYVGINAYFPLLDETTPQVSELRRAWQPVVADIRNFHDQLKLPIIFTEFGYLSVDQCAYKTWELEENIGQRRINEIAQANALDALFEVFWNENYWKGGFIWKWFPNMEGHEGYPERDYTPQGKLGQNILKKWYSK